MCCENFRKGNVILNFENQCIKWCNKDVERD